MRAFATLYEALGATRSTTRKVALLTEALQESVPEEAAVMTWLLSGERHRRLMTGKRLRELVTEETGLPLWLIDESYASVGDLAETLALLLPEPRATNAGLRLSAIHRALEDMRAKTQDEQAAFVKETWGSLQTTERLLFHKLLSGGLRVGVSKQLLIKALAALSGVEPATIAERLSGGFEPSARAYLELIRRESSATRGLRHYPFQLAASLEAPELVSPLSDWLIEWKWDGIRAQLIAREGAVAIWTRGEELVTERFPEIVQALEGFATGTVLDGELVAQRDGQVLPFSVLQRRIGRTRLTKKILAEAPVGFIAYDLLEVEGIDCRQQPLAQRRHQLHAILAQNAALQLSETLPVNSIEGLWTLRDQAQAQRAEGLMLKLKSSPYEGGRVRGAWWKWKRDPMTIDAVLVFAEAGHGRRSGIYSSHTFAVWHEGELQTIARAYSGLSEAELKELDRWIRKEATERFGPVRAVPPMHVFELAFDGIQAAPRRKAGLSLRFPRIIRWRRDKSPAEADHLMTLHTLLKAEDGTA